MLTTYKQTEIRSFEQLGRLIKSTKDKGALNVVLLWVWSRSLLIVAESRIPWKVSSIYSPEQTQEKLALLEFRHIETSFIRAGL